MTLNTADVTAVAQLPQASHVGGQTGPIQSQHSYLASECNRLTRERVRARRALADLVVLLGDLPARSQNVREAVATLMGELE
jgi:hypothetical protein